MLDSAEALHNVPMWSHCGLDVWTHQQLVLLFVIVFSVGIEIDSESLCARSIGVDVVMIPCLLDQRQR